jgi:hypothetical protein
VVKVWSSLSGKCIAQEHQRGPFEEGSQLTTLELCNGGTSLMSATEDARITFMDVQACPSCLSFHFPFCCGFQQRSRYEGREGGERLGVFYGMSQKITRGVLHIK